MNEPKLRFKADDGSQFPDWEEKKIGDITLSHNAGVYIAKDNYGTGTNIIGVGDIYESDVINGKQYRLAPVDSDEYILDEGDLVYGESSLVPEGIARTVCISAAGKGTAFAWHTRRYKVDRTIINPYFLTLQVNYAKRVRNHLMRVCTRNALTGMTTNEYFGTKVSVPCLPEQQKIAEFLSTIDTVIEKQKETVSAWEERKKGVMQKLFSQEVRFKADDGSEFPEWEEKKLKNILKEYKEYSAKDGSYEHVSLTKEGVVPKSERYERDFLVKDVDKKYRITHLGDICYNPANLKFGVICRNKYGDGIFSPIYVTFQVCKDMLPEFVEMLVTRRDFIEYALKYQQGTVYERMSVSPDDLLSIKVMVPCMTEQQKIADCLVSLDEVIEKQKATLAAWEELKKGLLQQMFV